MPLPRTEKGSSPKKAARAGRGRKREQAEGSGRKATQRKPNGQRKAARDGLREAGRGRRQGRV